MNTPKQPPTGVRAIYTLKAAAAALQIDERQLLDWVRAGHYYAAQHTPGGKFYMPWQQIQDLADKFWVSPDWLAAEDAS